MESDPLYFQVVFSYNRSIVFLICLNIFISQDDPEAHERFTTINKAYEVLKGR